MSNSHILKGHVLDILKRLPADSVQTVVTSPPYWQLREYGTQPQQWAPGDFAPMPGMPPITFDAWEGELGQEDCPWMFVGHIVQIFREVRRVLSDDGTLWLNFGDNWSSNAGGYNSAGSIGAGDSLRISKKTRSAVVKTRIKHKVAGLKEKEVCGVPWRVAFALQADGWYLRSDIIWHKPNPMPESVKDRPTKSHEYLFLMSKSARYYYDAEAICEPASGTAHARGHGVNPKAGKVPTGWDTGPGSHKTCGRHSRMHVSRDPAHKNRPKQNESFSKAISGALVETRNKRDVWTIPTFAYKDAHYATFPPDLVRPCILAGSRPGDTCLDPFGGSGTVGDVCRELARNSILIELHPGHIEQCERRVRNSTPGLGI